MAPVETAVSDVWKTIKAKVDANEATMPQRVNGRGGACFIHLHYVSLISLQSIIDFLFYVEMV